MDTFTSTQKYGFVVPHELCISLISNYNEIIFHKLISMFRRVNSFIIHVKVQHAATIIINSTNILKLYEERLELFVLMLP